MVKPLVAEAKKSRTAGMAQFDKLFFFNNTFSIIA
jgi:hypothetical protein